MKVTWDSLLERIREEPLEHLGGFSPSLLIAYFNGYEHALIFHHDANIAGDFGLSDFRKWFATTAYSGPQGWARYCLLITKSEEQALDLFFEFWKIAKSGDWTNDSPKQPSRDQRRRSVLETVNSDVMREKPALYFGNDEWLRGIWAMWNGYIKAEQDIGIEGSLDQEVFVGFQNWLRQRYAFAQEANFGKLFDFLALDVSKKALEAFYDHLELFLEGAPHDANTKRFQTFLDEALASALEKKLEREGDS
ncbi:MAG: hypothetical protein J5I65_01580 [Aridibacter famidurans]|nr:hypothetical protein [Aridibacter famidurans]